MVHGVHFHVIPITAAVVGQLEDMLGCCVPGAAGQYPQLRAWSHATTQAPHAELHLLASWSGVIEWRVNYGTFGWAGIICTAARSPNQCNALGRPRPVVGTARE